MKHTENLSKLYNITNVRIAKKNSEIGDVKLKLSELSSIQLKLMNECEDNGSELKKLINSTVSKIPDYYKLRSEIASLSGKTLVIENRLDSLKDDIKELNEALFSLNAEMKILHNKKRKYNKLLSEGF